MALVEYAKDELTRAGVMDKDSDYDGMLGTAVLELVEKFAEQGHSGMSAHLVTEMFNKVARYQPLTPITSDPKEWNEVEKGKTWQSRRNPVVFSKDAGQTWYSLDD